jgi:hypothetical protein
MNKYQTYKVVYNGIEYLIVVDPNPISFSAGDWMYTELYNHELLYQLEYDLYYLHETGTRVIGAYPELNSVPLLPQPITHAEIMEFDVEEDKQHFRIVKDINGIPIDSQYILVPKVVDNQLVGNWIIN